MSAAAPTKFTFDLDLGRRQDRARSVSEAVVATLTADARMAGYAEGFSAGEQSSTARAANQLAEAARQLADRAAAMAAQLDDERNRTLADAVGLAHSIARKLAGHLLAHQPTAEIEALIADSMGALDGVKHLVIRCRDELADAVRETAEARMQTSGFTGRLVVIGDPDMGLTDCRIEWADGGLVRDVTAISADIDARIAAFFGAHGIAGAEPSQETPS